MYEYRAQLVKVIDGDTIDVVLDLGFKLSYGIRLRLRGIDTPEMRAADPAERERAQKAKDVITELLTDKDLTVITSLTAKGDERRTFGRYVADVFFRTKEDFSQPTSVAEVMISRGLLK